MALFLKTAPTKSQPPIWGSFMHPPNALRRWSCLRISFISNVADPDEGVMINNMRQASGEVVEAFQPAA
jgi:hypothetical protein